MGAHVRRLVAFAHVADVQRSIQFYAGLGLEVKNTVESDNGSGLVWAWLENEEARLMVGLADAPVDASQQAVLFYLYVDSVEETRKALLDLNYSPGEINRPFYLPNGEFRLEDPDGYVLMIGQV